jgi:hypothetical protein
MSYDVTAMVRRARLPHTVKRRPLAKAVLLVLADDCHDDGTKAWPSLATIATEVEIGRRTAAKVLARLKAEGLIAEEAPPTQHRPRTWCLNLTRIAALTDAHDGAPLLHSDAQHGAPLSATAEFAGGAPDAQIRESDAQIRKSDAHAGAHEQSYERSIEQNSGFAASHAPRAIAEHRTKRLSRAPAADGNYRVIVRLAHETMDETGLSEPTDPDLIEALKQRCALAHIDYGRDSAVPFDVVHRALHMARMQRTAGVARGRR